MLSLLPRTATAAILALALGLGAAMAPGTSAQADSRDAARLIIGLTALYALGQAIDDNRHHGGHGHVYGHIGPRPHFAPGPRHVPHYAPSPRRVAPHACFREFLTNQGTIRGYLVRCTRNRVASPGLLPDQCITRLQTHNGTRAIYRAGCMRRNGWSV